MVIFEKLLTNIAIKRHQEEFLLDDYEDAKLSEKIGMKESVMPLRGDLEDINSYQSIGKLGYSR